MNTKRKVTFYIDAYLDDALAMLLATKKYKTGERITKSETIEKLIESYIEEHIREQERVNI